MLKLKDLTHDEKLKKLNCQHWKEMKIGDLITVFIMPNDLQEINGKRSTTQGKETG